MRTLQQCKNRATNAGSWECARETLYRTLPSLCFVVGVLAARWKNQLAGDNPEACQLREAPATLTGSSSSPCLISMHARRAVRAVGVTSIITTASFMAERRPAAGRYEELSTLDPANPFATFAHVRAEEGPVGEPWLLECRDRGRLVCGCIGFVRRGRMNCRLTITSLPEVSEDFWAGMKSLIAKERITILELNTFSSRTLNIPSLGTELGRKRRYEYVVPLDGTPDDILRRMHKHHRQSVRKGMDTGLVVRTGNECRLEDHVKVIGASMQRRVGRGEQIESPPTLEGLQACLNSGLCRLFQACRGDEVVSSMSLAIAPRGRYLHTSGTSPEGMKSGASHYLLYEIMRVSIAEGATLLNLGGVSDPDSGLAQYKRHFGSDCWESEAAQFYVGSGLRRVAWNSAVLLKDLLKLRRTTATGTEA